MGKQKRNESSKKRFHEYVNKVIEVYRETGDIKCKELGKEYGCRHIPDYYFTKYGLGSVSRQLTIEETEMLYSHRGNPNNEAFPKFGEQSPSEAKVEEKEEQAIRFEVEEPKENAFTRIINSTKEMLCSFFKKRKATGFYLQHTKVNNTDIYAWRNHRGFIDFVIEAVGNTVIDSRRVEQDDPIQSWTFNGLGEKQIFRIAFFAKMELDKAHRENEILRRRLDAVAQILLIEEEKEENVEKNEDLFGGVE